MTLDDVRSFWLVVQPDCMSMPLCSFETVEFATLEWVDWFNHRRLLEPIGNIPPDQAEQQYFAVLDQMKTAT